MVLASRPSDRLDNEDFSAPTAMFHLLSVVPYEAVADLQRRLIDDALMRGDARIVVLVCEHAPIITVGHQGSRRQVRWTAAELAARRLETRWVNRRGGCWLHLPGQLAIYVIAPLFALGWSPTEYGRRLRQGLADSLAELGFHGGAEQRPAYLMGRHGVLAALGAGVKDGVTHHGAVVNVHPSMNEFEQVELPTCDDPQADPPPLWSSLLAEHRQPVKMTSVRAALPPLLAAALGCPRYNLTTGHPWLPMHQRLPASLVGGTGTLARPEA